ncbi:hypothetical protein GQ53DRAFT_225935 [Thozetella sp. PMI_491]|nr:hypothetical protein GQ53DRAFT_225935 [Thozetella sp. PMI_491]
MVADLSTFLLLAVRPGLRECGCRSPSDFPLMLRGPAEGRRPGQCNAQPPPPPPPGGARQRPRSRRRERVVTLATSLQCDLAIRRRMANPMPRHRHRYRGWRKRRPQRAVAITPPGNRKTRSADEVGCPVTGSMVLSEEFQAAGERSRHVRSSIVRVAV